MFCCFVDSLALKSPSGERSIKYVCMYDYHHHGDLSLISLMSLMKALIYYEVFVYLMKEAFLRHLQSLDFHNLMAHTPG